VRAQSHPEAESEALLWASRGNSSSSYSLHWSKQWVLRREVWKSCVWCRTRA